uniref:Uncharacterized protein n=1 Tax=Pipistrellus kuhlii TaxID=59472 RepID=A0A7J7WLD7_PIPKU|nr:hypothetical protein mPipKuh1_007969 [Pipistrellus kuhlii]
MGVQMVVPLFSCLVDFHIMSLLYRTRGPLQKDSCNRASCCSLCCPTCFSPFSMLCLLPFLLHCPTYLLLCSLAPFCSTWLPSALSSVLTAILGGLICIFTPIGWWAWLVGVVKVQSICTFLFY